MVIEDLFARWEVHPGQLAIGVLKEPVSSDFRGDIGIVVVDPVVAEDVVDGILDLQQIQVAVVLIAKLNLPLLRSGR
jgi:hypothetical protein